MEEDSIKLRIKKARQKIGMTGKEVAEEIGVSPVTYSRYETGRRTPTLNHLISLSDVFNVTTDYFLHIEGEYFEVEQKIRDLRSYIGVKQNMIKSIRKYVSFSNSDDPMENNVADSYLEYAKEIHDNLLKERDKWLEIVGFETIEEIIAEVKNDK